MTLQSSGQISMSDINGEFARGNDFNSYRGTTWYTDTYGVSGTFSSGSISMSEFYSKRGSSPPIPYTPTLVAYTSVGTSYWTCPAGVTSIKLLVVAGGGGGGTIGWTANAGTIPENGGGGGAGGVLYYSSYAVTPGVNYTVTIGTGGFGAFRWQTRYVNGQTLYAYYGQNGSDSVFGSETAKGGGGGGGGYTRSPSSGGLTGGSGGGGTPYKSYGWNGAGLGTAGQGNNGASGSGYGGGGGGASGAGSSNGTGGAGVVYTFKDSSNQDVTYSVGGGGGGGGIYGSGAASNGGGAGWGPFFGQYSGKDGSANTGGGGGGTGGNGGGDVDFGPTHQGGNGGTGIVVIGY